ncbi:glycine zipper family protein [Microbulbifer aestuariivivens]|uniref:glycine zipper family protein n=1 Tax=Microbulbifer aestuariivivens TaxID=1908308 RepID=UPI0031E5B3AF
MIDTQGVNMTQYQRDLMDCRSNAYYARADAGRRGVTQAAGGALLGGALGAIVGDSSRAAAAGAGAGALLGGVSGVGSSHREEDRIVKSCLRFRGYHVLN